MNASLPSRTRSGVLACLGLLGVSLTGDAREFLSVTVSDRFFQSPSTNPVVQARLREPLQLDVLVYEAGGRPLAFIEGSTPAVEHQVPLTALPPADRGLYLFHLFTLDAAGKRIDEYPPQPEGGAYIDVADCRWDPATQRIHYFLPRAACVRIRAGLTDSAYVSEVLPWEAQPSGRKSIPWPGATNNPVVREMLGRPDFQTRVLALSLPANLVADERLRTQRFAGNNTPSTPLPDRYSDRKAMPGGTLYSTVRRSSQISIADDYRLSLAAEPAPGRGVVLLRLDCAEADRGRLLNQRFEVMVFLDGVFLMEDETALLPFNYRMSTRGLAPGQHLVTLNVLDSQGVPGTASAFIQVTPEQSNSRGEP